MSIQEQLERPASELTGRPRWQDALRFVAGIVVVPLLMTVAGLSMCGDIRKLAGFTPEAWRAVALSWGWAWVFCLVFHLSWASPIPVDRRHRAALQMLGYSALFAAYFGFMDQAKYQDANWNVLAAAERWIGLRGAAIASVTLGVIFWVLKDAEPIWARRLYIVAGALVMFAIMASTANWLLGPGYVTGIAVVGKLAIAATASGAILWWFRDAFRWQPRSAGPSPGSGFVRRNRAFLLALVIAGWTGLEVGGKGTGILKWLFFPG